VSANNETEHHFEKKTCVTRYYQFVRDQVCMK